MGLDMYACKIKEEVKTEVDFVLADSEELYYWRKHPNLHGWMDQLYRDKGGVDEDFNCVNVKLTLEDLEQLENTIKNGDLPSTSGFFFGKSDNSEEEKNEDLTFVEKAREAINEGYTVYYTSSW